ncbi:hypothetical protein MMC14_007396 [Varicellaria rhodocarpa]|nr:hypothetical protein [Varicellaria rhodocarpa]
MVAPSLAVQDYDSSPSSPFTRASSPSPSISPTPALSACPPLGRCFSTGSTVSTFSARSSTSRSSSGSAVSRRRGYVRPEGALFADSARNRDSVMSLGSIAHLQHYFARTGVLDGKGGQLAKEGRTSIGAPRISLGGFSEDGDSTITEPFTSELMSSPVDEYDLSQVWDEPMMLPPTVSTYNHKTHYIAPPPDIETMRDNLKKALLDVTDALSRVQNQGEDGSKTTVELAEVRGDIDSSSEPQSNQGWHELQGMHMLDVVTLAIRAAKIYYTMHEHPQRLAIIKTERQIREELLGVLDVLKRMGARQFMGGIKGEEIQVMEDWVQNVKTLLVKEEATEEQETRDRNNWKWLEGKWAVGDREREWLFMTTFLEFGELPEWPSPSDTNPLPSPFLEALRNGLLLVKLHNTILKKTRKHFGEIKTYHIDTGKPYRTAENLRFWIKAAEIRWEVKLKMDVMGVVYSISTDAWKGFDAAILAWCQAVREEITREWRQGIVQVPNIAQPDATEFVTAELA